MEFLIVLRSRNRRSELQRQITLRLHNTIRDVTDPFKDPHFQLVYRLTPELAKSVIDELRPYYPQTANGNAIPVDIKFLAALHFYAQGSYQKCNGRDAVVSLSKASVCRAIAQTTLAINKTQVLTKWIKFPKSANEKEQVIEKNYRKFNMPGILGFDDGSHILIKKPALHEDLYINRKGQHSLNVQVVCDCDLLILNILAKYPGSTHNAFIWKASAVREEMKVATNAWLLGDPGYPSEPWLLTPILNAEESSQEARYTQMHILARNSIERCFGVLKGRFRCLNKNRVLEYAPAKSGQIVNACAVLHNICTITRLNIDNLLLEDDDDDHEDNVTHQNTPQDNVEDSNLLQRALDVRASLVNRL